MDENTLRFLRERQTPRDLAKRAFKEERTFAEDKQRLQDLSRNPKLSLAQKDRVKQLLNANESRGMYDKKTLVVDPKVTKQIERFHERNIAEGIASGKIKRFDPSKDAQAQRLFHLAQKKK